MFLAIGAGETLAEAQAWKATHGLTMPVFPDADDTIWTLFGMGYVPHNTVLDCSKEVLYSYYGFEESTVIGHLDDALADITVITQFPMDTENVSAPVQVNISFEDAPAINPGYPVFAWNTDGGGTFTSQIMTATARDTVYTTEIPVQSEGTNIYYYVEIQNAQSCNLNLPPGAPTGLNSFHVGVDLTPPVINHTSNPNYASDQLPLEIETDVTDNMGVDAVLLEYKINGGAVNTLPMTSRSHYAVTIPDALIIDDFVEYRIIATDLAAVANTAYHPESGYHMTTIIDRIPAIVIDLDGGHNSGPVIRDTLNSVLGSSEYQTSMPDNLGLYSSIFVCLGMYGSNNHILTGEQGQQLADFLDAGGRVYMEGGDTWYYDGQTAVHPYFNLNSSSDGSGDAGPINGVSGSFTEGLSWGYNTAGAYNSYVDRLTAGTGAQVILQNGSPVYDNGIAWNSGTYKTVGASILFGGITNTANSTKQELMVKITEFFDLGAEATPTPEPTATPSCLHNGDPTLDGEITSGDAQLAFTIGIGAYIPTSSEECAADCDNSGYVSSGDAQSIFISVIEGFQTCEDPI